MEIDNEGVGVESTSPETLGQGENQPITEGGNPKWQPFLDVLPTSLHGVVTPVLQDWDRGVQERFTEIHQQYEPYKQYQALVDNQIDPQAIEYALGIFNQLNENPRAIYDALAQTFAEEWGLNKQPVAEDLSPSYESFQENQPDPRIDQLEQGFRQLAETILGERQQIQQREQEAQQDQALETELSGLRQTYGDFNENMVLALMLSGMTGEQAVQQYKSDIAAQLEASKRPPAPSVLSQGGLVASTQDVRKLSGADTRALVAQRLAQAQQQI